MNFENIKLLVDRKMLEVQRNLLSDWRILRIKKLCLFFHWSNHETPFFIYKNLMPKFYVEWLNHSHEKLDRAIKNKS